MNLQLKNKVAVVTGASKGIGAGIAKELAAEGAKVVVNYSSSKSDADKVVADIKAAGGQAVAIQANVADAAQVANLFEKTKAAFGPADILVNNAGIYRFSPIEGITETDFHDHFNTNVLGVILTTQQAVAHFADRGGSIVNISSVVATNPSANTSVYSATKGALNTLSRAHALELAPRKIRVNVVSPGATETEGAISAGIVGSDFINKVIADTPLGRIGQPADIASLVVFLASDSASWLTGETINASGGLH
jgi:3-oxoacyl-[acyl-carrier protein] reductase